MSERTLEKIVNSRFNTITSVTIVSWTFALYWISVSGSILIVPKVLFLLMPVSIIIAGIINNAIKKSIDKSRKRDEIILRSYIRRLSNNLM